METLFVFDGMKRPSFTVKIDVESSTVADLFNKVCESYQLEFNPRRNLRIIFADKELKYTRRKKLCDVGIQNHSTIAVIFQLPDKNPTAPATVEDVNVEAKTVEEQNKDKEKVSVAEVETVKAKKIRDEEDKDVTDVAANKSESVKTDEENKAAANDVSSSETGPVKTDEEKKDVNEVSVSESEPAKKSDAAKEISTAESEPVKMVEESKDANNVCVANETGEAVSNLEETAIESKNAINVSVPATAVSNITPDITAVGEVEKEEKRPKLQRLPGIVELAFLPDFLNLDFEEERAIMLPCHHMMGSDTMRSYCQNLVDRGNTKFPCPYPLFPFSPLLCPEVWDYRLVRHVACFTTKEMHDIERTTAINFVGKDSSTLSCPGCFTWCSKMDSKLTRLRCFLCTRETGNEFLFCGYCLREWKNAHSGKCANPECESIEKTLDILRTSPVTNLYGGTWPTRRLCPRCGIMTEFMGLCSQIHCQLCGYDYCFLCLKGAKSKAALQCVPYDSSCQRASLQTSIPQWDGHESD